MSKKLNKGWLVRGVLHYSRNVAIFGLKFWTWKVAVTGQIVITNEYGLYNSKTAIIDGLDNHTMVWIMNMSYNIIFLLPLPLLGFPKPPTKQALCSLYTTWTIVTWLFRRFVTWVLMEEGGVSQTAGNRSVTRLPQDTVKEKPR